MKSRIWTLIKLMEELGIPVSRLMGEANNILPIKKPVLVKPTIDLSSVNPKSLINESTETLNLARNNKLSGQEIEQAIQNLKDIKATTQAKPSATVIEMDTRKNVSPEGIMNLAKDQKMSKSIPGKAKQLQGRVQKVEKEFTDFTNALDARGEIPGASRQEAIEIAKAKMKGMGYTLDEIEDIAKDPKRIQTATDIIIPDEGFQMGGRVGLKKGSSYFSNLIKENIPPEYRLYAKSILPGGKKGKVDESYFTENFKQDLRQQALTKFKETGKLKGSIGEMDTHYRSGVKNYGQGEKYPINKLIGVPSTFATLGSYNYEIDPKTSAVKITDTYDWNPAYGKNASSGKIGWIGNKKGKDVDKSMLKDFVMQSYQTGEIDKGDVLELLGNYLGPKASKGEGIKVDINIPSTDIPMGEGETFATGGRVGLEKGGKPPKVKTTIPMNPMMEEGFDPSKRGFLKGTGAAGLGLTALGTGAVRLGKKTSKKIKDIDIDMGVDVDGDYSDTLEGFEAFYNTFFKIKANTKAGKKLLDKLAKEKKIVKEKDGTYYGDTGENIDSPTIDALEDIKNQSSYDLSFEGKKFKNTDEAGDYFRGNTKEASPVKPDYYTVREDEFLTEDMGEVVNILAPKSITKQIKEEVEKRIRNVEREALKNTLKNRKAEGGRIEMVGGGSVYDQYQNYLKQADVTSSDPLYYNMLYNTPSIDNDSSGDEVTDPGANTTVGNSKVFDYYNNDLGYLGRTGINSLISMVNPMIGGVAQMYNQGKSAYDATRGIFNTTGFGNFVGGLFGAPQGKDQFGNPLNVGNVESGLDTIGGFTGTPQQQEALMSEMSVDYGGGESSGAAGTGNSNASEAGGSDSMGSF